MRREEIVRVASGLLLAGALVLAVVILTGSEDDSTVPKALMTAAAVAFFTPLLAAGLALPDRRSDLGVFAHLGVAVPLAGFAIVAVSIWSNDALGGWRATYYALLVALAGGQISVLLALATPGEWNGLRLLRAITIVAVAILTVLGISEISALGDAVDARGIAVAAVVYGAGTIILLLVALVERRTGPPLRAASMPQLDHVGVPVADWERSGTFYREVLGVTDARPAHADLSFAWEGSAASAIEHLGRHGVAVLGPPAPRDGARGSGQSIYFRDPSGRLIELIAYG